MSLFPPALELLDTLNLGWYMWQTASEGQKAQMGTYENYMEKVAKKAVSEYIKQTKKTGKARPCV